MKKNIENSDMPIRRPTTFAPRNVRRRKIENGISGCLARLSQARKAPISASASAPRPSVWSEPQP